MRQRDAVACGRRGLRGPPGGADRLGRDHVEQHRPLRGDEAESRHVGLLEARLHRVRPVIGSLQRLVRSHVAQMRGVDDAGFGDALPEDLGAGLLGHGVEPRLGLGGAIERQVGLHLAHGPDFGKTHAVGGEHPGMGMDQDAPHAERVGDEAGVLPAGAAEALQGVAGDVAAALHADLLDGVGHVVDGDAQEAGGGLLGRAHRLAGLAGDGVGHLGEAGARGVGVERHVAGGPEHRWEVIRADPAEHDVAVGDGRWAAAAVAGGAGIGRRAFGADLGSGHPRTCRLSRRPRRRCGCPSSGRASAPRPPRSRSCARSSPRSG